MNFEEFRKTDKFDEMREAVYMAIEEHGWLKDDGSWLSDEELNEWDDHQIYDAYYQIYAYTFTREIDIC